MQTLHRFTPRSPDQPPRPKRAVAPRALFALLLALLVAATFLLNLVVLQLDDRYGLTLDLTANAAFQPGAETRALLAGLDQDVAIYVLAAPDAFGGSPYLVQAQRMIAQYPRLSPRVSLTYVDYVLDPTFASRYPDLTLSQGDVLVTCGDRVKQIGLGELFNYTYTDTGQLAIVSSRAEEALTSAILYVTSERDVHVAVLTGYDVAEMPAFTDLLTANNYVVTPVNLTTEPLDDRYDLAVLLAPRIDLSPEALKKLDDFLYNQGAYGKTLFYTTDVAQPDLPNLDAFLKEWGLVVGDGAVFETTAERTFQYQPYYPTAAYVDEARRDELLDPSAPMLLPLARPLEVLFSMRDNRYTEVLLQFSETAGVRPPDATDDFVAADAERWGPLPALVLASTRIYGNTGVTQFRSNLVVSASTAMLDASALQSTALANSPYLLNLINSLCERTDAVNIAPKSLAGNALAISTAEMNTLGIVLVGVVPLGILLAGIAVWLSRRYQ